MALRGTLRDFSLGEILQLIGFQRKTGILTIEGVDDTVSISFLEGRVVSADSHHADLENRLGRLLVRAGKIDAGGLERVLEEQRRTRQRLGAILLGQGRVSSGDLRLALRTQILNLIYRLFRWEDGRYYFSQLSTVSYDSDNFTPVETENILMEAARMSDEWPLIHDRIPSLDIVFRRAPGAGDLQLVADGKEPESPGTLAVSRNEAMAWEAIDGRRTLAEITESIFLSDFDTVKAVDQLLGRGLLVALPRAPEPVRAPVPPQTREMLQEARERKPGSPWPLWIALAAVLAASLYLMPRNPVNFLTNPTRRSASLNLVSRAIEIARLQRVDRGIEVFYLSQGKYPESLAELPSSFILPELDLPKGRFGQYLYILRPADGRYNLYGKTGQGTIDPNLSFIRRLDPVSDEVVGRLKHKRSQPQAVEGNGIDLVK
jgi:hypothetical protein